MKVTSLIVLGFLVGCSGAPDSGSETAMGDPPSSSDDGYYSSSTHHGSSGPCGNAAQAVKLNLPDGGVVVIIVPIPCNPNWIDKGDPPPDREREQIVDPNPWELPVSQAQRQQVR